MHLEKWRNRRSPERAQSGKNDQKKYRVERGGERLKSESHFVKGFSQLVEVYCGRVKAPSVGLFSERRLLYSHRTITKHSYHLSGQETDGTIPNVIPIYYKG